jgi:hypothetical protein
VDSLERKTRRIERRTRTALAKQCALSTRRGAKHVGVGACAACARVPMYR